MRDTPTNSRPRLQLAVDVLSLEEALAAVERVGLNFDILEVGTPLVIEEGLRAVEALKKRCPDKPVLADLKIMDAGRLEANSGFGRGADIVTILGLADDATVRGAVEAAQRHGGQLMADLIHTPDPARRARELADLGVHLLCVHTAYDLQHTGADPLAELACVRAVTERPLAVAGGIKLSHVTPAVKRGADILVVGSAVLGDPDPRAAAAAFLSALTGAAA